ncbi:MAG: hypothetical protein HEQ23_12465 [Tepidisphaera sp.]
MSRTTRHSGPVLRLVGTDATPHVEPARRPEAREAVIRRVAEEAAARREVARENRLASTLSPQDARWRLAVDVASSLEGGKAAMLTPERRRKLLVRAEELGLRPFDANLVIAVVQDAQTEGRALTPETQARLLLVRPADPAKLDAAGRKFIAALILAAVMLFGLGILAFQIR